VKHAGTWGLVWPHHSKPLRMGLTFLASGLAWRHEMEEPHTLTSSSQSPVWSSVKAVPKSYQELSHPAWLLFRLFLAYVTICSQDHTDPESQASNPQG
jgi:hypothetical protein